MKKEIESFLRGSCKRRKDKKRASEGGVAKKEVGEKEKKNNNGRFLRKTSFFILKFCGKMNTSHTLSTLIEEEEEEVFWQEI